MHKYFIKLTMRSYIFVWRFSGVFMVPFVHHKRFSQHRSLCFTAAASQLSLKQIFGLVNGSKDCFNLVLSFCPWPVRKRQMAEIWVKFGDRGKGWGRQPSILATCKFYNHVTDEEGKISGWLYLCCFLVGPLQSELLLAQHRRWAVKTSIKFLLFVQFVCLV